MTPTLSYIVGLITSQLSKRIEDVEVTLVLRGGDGPEPYFYLTTRMGTRFRVTVEQMEKEPERVAERVPDPPGYVPDAGAAWWDKPSTERKEP